MKQNLLPRYYPAFFPHYPPYPALQYSNSRLQISMPLLTKENVCNAIFLASSFCAGGIEGLPSVVQQKLWPILKSQITQLFCSSFHQCKRNDVVTRTIVTGPLVAEPRSQDHTFRVPQSQDHIFTHLLCHQSITPLDIASRYLASRKQSNEVSLVWPLRCQKDSVTWLAS